MTAQGRIYSAVAGLSLAVLAACGGSSGGDGSSRLPDPGPAGLVSTPPAVLALEHEASCDAFKSHISNSIVDLVLNVGVVACPSCAVRATVGGALEVPASTDTASFDAFTGTNNQEQGVDELDDIEADANGNFFLVDGNHLVVANGLPPADLREVASIELTDEGHVEGLVLDPDNARVVAVVSNFDFFGPWTLSILPPSKPLTQLVFVDVADPANPVIGARLDIEGFRLAVRRIGDRIHVVSHTTPAIPALVIDDARLSDLRRRLVDAITGNDSFVRAALTRDIEALVDALVATTDARDYLPDITLRVGGADIDARSPTCADVAVPDVTMPLALTSITSIDSDGQNVDSLTVANNSWNVYASEQNIYLTQTSGGWWFSDQQRQQTAIYKIEIGAGAPVYRALGLVDGWAGSSFQLSEHEDHLRVATNRWERDPATDVWLRDNNLYVLRDDGIGGLDVVGSVRGFAENETIFGTRFLGDRAFVVTFRQIDPLFTFDLSIPTDPRLVGQVEIPGVSTYLHPLDDTHLLTIGYDGDDAGLNGDFQLQIFDVQDLAQPRLLHKHVPVFDADGFAWTRATFDHLAFNYFAQAGTLTVPMQYVAANRDEHFSGFIAFSVDTAAGFTELGRLDHSDLARQSYCNSPDGTTPVVCDDGVYLEAASPRRSVSALFEGETYVYTLSNVGMKVSPAGDFGNPAAVLPLPHRNEYPWLTF